MQHHNAQPTSPQRVVVLGAKGFLAHSFLGLLAENQIPHVAVGSGQVDLTTPNAAAQLRQIVKPDDAVVMLSALTPDKGKDVRTFLKNVAMGEQVCAFLETSRCNHLVYVSSDAVYDDAQSLVNESTPLTGLGLYGLSHVVRERMLQATCASRQIPLCIVRPCAIYGAGDTHNAYGPNRFIRSALNDQKISLFGNGEEERDHIFVEDVCRFLMLVLTRRSAGAVQITSGTSVTFAALAEMITKLVPHAVQIEHVPRQPRTAVTHRQFDNSLRLREFPEIECTSLESGLSRMHQSLSRQGLQPLAGG